MKTISYKLKDLDQKEKKVTLKLGYVGENEHVQIRIDCSEIWENYPNAVASLAVEPPEGSKYPAIVTREGNVVCWTVKDSDVVHDGDGRIQLTFTEGSEIQKTVICRTKVDESIIGSGTTPDPIADFVAEANEALAELEAAEVHGPVIGEDGYWYTWSKDAGEYVKTDTKAQGEDGQQGPAGKDGADGAPGQDGHTPVRGTDYWTQQDQADIVAAAALETVSAVIDDTAGDGDTNKTWSADKIAETTGQLLTAIQGKYEKPSGGIPSTDMTQAVQDSLSAADSALIGVGKSEERDGIVQTGDTATKNIASGKYVIWKGSLYTASSNIATGETLSLSNLSPVSDGGYNALLDKIGEQSDEMEVVFDYTVEEENTGNNMILNLTKPCKKITCYIISTGNHPTQYRIKANNYTLGYVNWTANNVRHVMIIYDCVNKFGLVMSSTGGKSTSGWAANNNYILSNAIDDVHSISTIELTRDDGNDLVFPIGTTIKIYGK